MAPAGHSLPQVESQTDGRGIQLAGRRDRNGFMRGECWQDFLASGSRCSNFLTLARTRLVQRSRRAISETHLLKILHRTAGAPSPGSIESQSLSRKRCWKFIGEPRALHELVVCCNALLESPLPFQLSVALLPCAPSLVEFQQAVESDAPRYFRIEAVGISRLYLIRTS